MKTTLAWLRFVAALSVLAITTSCSHEITSPKPKLENTLEPDLVCNAKPVDEEFSTVVIHGSNFTPMPSKTLEDKRELILPKIQLIQTQALDGAAIASKPIDIKDDPAKPAESRVHWASEKEMSFDVLEEDKLLSGVFSVKVTNPDGKSAATIERGLAIIPAPVISEIMPPAICDDQADQTVTVTGKYFLIYGDKAPTVTVGAPPGQKTYPGHVELMSCKLLEGNFSEGEVRLCTSLTFTVPLGDFPVTEPTKVSVVITNPAPADCASSQVVELTINPPPRVDSVVPATVCEGGSQVKIDGKFFQPGATVQLVCTGGTFNASSVTVMPDGTVIDATFPGGAPPGETCDIVVQNADGCQDRPLPHKTVTVVTGPILFYVDPPVVYNGINTRVTLFVTAISNTPSQPIPTVTMTPTGMTMPVITLDVKLVPGHPNRLQATVPAGTPAGDYDITVDDGEACNSTLVKAIRVTDTLTVTIDSVVPPFGHTSRDTAITIFRDTMAPAAAAELFKATPRVFLNPTNPAPTDVAGEVGSVSFVDGDTVTGVVPKGTPVHDYDLVLVNPDGTVGVLNAAYRETQDAPPVIDTATPSSIVNATGQQVVLKGTSFGIANTVALTCQTPTNTTLTPPVTNGAPTCDVSGACTETITIDGSTLPPGTACVVRLTHTDPPDGSYGDYSAIGVTGSSLNITAPKQGTAMNTGRRALSAATGSATTAARFVYAIGGDNGTIAGAFDSVEFAPVDIFGKLGAWTTQPVRLSSARTLAGAATFGRYIYLVGGDGGMGPVGTAERALILSPREAPVIDDVDLALGAKGLDQGQYIYRVSAVFAANDTDNPGGESLASDPFTIKLPAFANKKIAVTLVWKAPVDVLDQALPNVAGYRIYRNPTPADPPGSEVLLATVNNPAQLTFQDDGSAVPGTEKPLPLGSTGRWAQLPTMGTLRSGPAVAIGKDPTLTDTFYVYALVGKNGANTVTNSYELLKVTVAPNGRQTFDPAWTVGTAQSSAGRWQLGAWVVDETVQTNYAGQTWIFAGPGANAAGTGPAGALEAARVQNGGQLTAFTTTNVSSPNPSRYGYGICAANQQLFLFGGDGPDDSMKSSKLFDNNGLLPPPENVNFNDQGVKMSEARYLFGSTVQSAFIFLLGGQTGTSQASATAEFVIW